MGRLASDGGYARRVAQEPNGSTMSSGRVTAHVIRSEEGGERKYLLPSGAHVLVKNGQVVYPGD